MKTVASTIAAIFLLLFVVTTFVPYPAARIDAKDAGFTDEEIATGLEYLFERRFFSWPSTFIELTILCVFALTSASRKLADHMLAWTGQRRILAALGVGLTIVLVNEFCWLPLGIARLYHSRAWGLSNLDLVGWLQQHALSFAIGRLVEAISVAGLYCLLIYLPRFWWLVAPLAASGLGVAYAFLAPILINPLYNTFTPLSETPWKDQESRVRALIDKAGVPVGEILVMDGSRQSNHTNAYFTGFGPTRRIVLYDTLLKNHTEAEIETILAHELGHWQHDHIVKGILLATLAAAFGFFLLDRVLRYATDRGPWRLQSIADPAGLPLVMLMIFLGTWGVMPVQNVVSRYFETQADQTSLDLAGQPEVFQEAERKLARINKSNVAPTPWNVWFFSSHPPTVERIRHAEEWKKKRN